MVSSSRYDIFIKTFYLKITNQDIFKFSLNFEFLQKFIKAFKNCNMYISKIEYVELNSEMDVLQ